MKYYLKSYMHTHRLRAGFTQSDIAYLIGNESRSQISRYERLEREPTLTAFLMYKLVFQRSDVELYPALVAELEERVRKHAQVRYEELQGNPSWQTKERLDAFEALLTHLEQSNRD